jgi:hypothetical protein
VDNSDGDSSYRELEEVFYHFHKEPYKILLEDFEQNWREKVFSNQQLGITAYMKILEIMLLE